MDPTPLQRLAELDRKQRRRGLITSVLVTTMSWLVLFGGYYIAPFDNAASGALMRFAVGGLLFVGVVAWQVVRITQSARPVWRAAEAFAVVIALFLVMLAGSYLALSHSASGSFSEPLTHTSSMYFTITVLGTVGFGDITPRTDLARALVSAQMLIDLGLIAAVARLFINAARSHSKPLSAGPES